MSLPVSVLALSPAPRLIDPGSYKASVNFDIPGLDDEMRNLVCGQAINTLAMKATGSRLRTFTYNLMAKDNYQSSDFVDMCTYAGKYSLNEYSKEYASCVRNAPSVEPSINFRSLVIDKVPEAVTLWMTSLISRYKDMEYELGSSLYHSASKLNKHYQESIKEIEIMNFNPQQLAALQALVASQQQPQQVYPGMMGNGGMVNVVISGQTYQVPMEQALQLKAMQQQQQLQYGQGSGNVLLNQLLSGAQQQQQQPLNLMGTGTGQSPINLGIGVPQQAGNADLMNAWRRERGEPEATSFDVGSPIKASVPDTISTVEVARPRNSTPVSEPVKAAPVAATTTKKESDMFYLPEPSEDECGKFTLFGEREYNIPRYNLMQLGIETNRLLTDSPVEPVQSKVLEGDSEPTEIRQECRINSNLLYYRTKAGLIGESQDFHKGQVLELPSTNGFITVTHGLAIKPIANPSKAFVEICNASRGITYLAATMHSVTEVLQGTADRANRANLVPYINELSQISICDSWLTERVNECLAYVFLDKATIDSFAGDYHSLEKFISGKYGAEGILALDRYMDNALASLRSGSADSVKSFARDHLSIKDETTPVAALTEHVMVANLPVNSFEFGIKTVDTKFIIDKDNNLPLFNLIRAIENVGETLEFEMLFTYIVTADGCTFRAFRSDIRNKNVKYILERMKDM